MHTHARENERKKRRLKYCALLLLIALAVPLVWACANRFIAPTRSVRLFSHESTTTWPEPKTLRVAAYNIAHARGPQASTDNWTGDRKNQLAKLAALIQSWDADVVVLNEADFDATWSGGINQAQWIAKQAGYPYHAEQRNYDVSLPFFKLRFGNAILSRWPILNAERIELPAFSKWESWFVGKKNALLVTLDVKGKPLRVLGVHLEVRDPNVRQASVPILANTIAASDTPTLIAGDFNCKLIEVDPAKPADINQSASSRLLKETSLTWIQADQHHKLQGSFPSLKPKRLIDYIFADDTFAWEAFDVIDSDLSDHRPVIAEFKRS